jgi:hypothetical protein
VIEVSGLTLGDMNNFELLPCIDHDDAGAAFPCRFIQGLGRWTAARVLPTGVISVPGNLARQNP